MSHAHASKRRTELKRANGRKQVAKEPTIASFMTPSPHCIGKAQTIETAQTLMRNARLRHLPVLEAGKLVGMLSQRDVYFTETIHGVDPSRDTVEDAMSQDTYQVAPSALLRDVVRTMATAKVGSAVVVDGGGKVVGVFTTTDAMKLLYGLLE
jgi:acetoin utilization protein AcuB